jgi:hypothetical protein
VGEFADDAIDRALQEENDLHSFVSGQITWDEAMERGILDETTGEIPPEAPELEISDYFALERELLACELAFEKISRRRLAQSLVRKNECYWVTASGEKLRPKDMTLPHLRNALAYSERKGITGTVVDLIREEIKRREQ